MVYQELVLKNVVSTTPSVMLRYVQKSQICIGNLICMLKSNMLFIASKKPYVFVTPSTI